MATINVIPAGTYTVGTYPFGPANVPAGTVRAALALDTTNYDSGPSPTLEFKVQLSQDSGATYQDLLVGTWTGPNATFKGAVAHTTSIAQDLPGAAPAGNVWRVKGQATVSGQSYVSAAPGVLTLT